MRLLWLTATVLQVLLLHHGRRASLNGTTSISPLAFLFLQEVIQVLFGSFPVLISYYLSQSILHTCRHTFISSLLALVPLGTVFNNGLDFLVKLLILLFQVLHEYPREQNEAFLLLFHFSFKG